MAGPIWHQRGRVSMCEEWQRKTQHILSLDALRDQKSPSPLKLELQMIVSLLTGVLGTKLTRAVSVLNI